MDFNETVLRRHTALVYHIAPDAPGDRESRVMVFHAKMFADFFQFLAVRAFSGMDHKLPLGLVSQIGTEDFQFHAATLPARRNTVNP
jgi:hypothetical protein